MKKFQIVAVSVIMTIVILVSAAGCAAPAAQAPSTDSSTSVEPASVADTEILTALKGLDSNRGKGKTIGVVAFYQANDWNRNALAAIKKILSNTDIRLMLLMVMVMLPR